MCVREDGTMKVIASYSIKGGVGKTATSVNLVYGLAMRGLRTLLIDLDPQGASSFYFRVRAADGLKAKKFLRGRKKLLKFVRGSDYDNLDILPAKLAYRNFDVLLNESSKSQRLLAKVLKTFKDEYDVVMLDVPASITLLAENVFDAADVVLVPVIPTTLSQRTYEQLRKFFKRIDLPPQKIVPFFAMVQRGNPLHEHTIDAMRSKFPGFLETTIPLAIEIEMMGEKREPVLQFARLHPGGRAYDNLCREVAKLVKAA